MERGTVALDVSSPEPGRKPADCADGALSAERFATVRPPGSCHRVRHGSDGRDGSQSVSRALAIRLNSISRSRPARRLQGVGSQRLRANTDQEEDTTMSQPNKAIVARWFS